MRRTRTLALVAAAAVASTLALGGTGSATARDGHGHEPPASRVVIVLFDQMVPQYADQFNMPNYRKIRDAGTNYKQAYLGYMASETVIAHNVIPSGLNPKNMGYTDEAYRDHGNVFGKGIDAMHITGDLSLDDFVKIQKNHGQTYPSWPTTCTRRDRAPSSSPSARRRTPWRRPPAQAGTSPSVSRAGRPTSPPRPAAATCRSPGAGDTAHGVVRRARPFRRT